MNRKYNVLLISDPKPLKSDNSDCRIWEFLLRCFTWYHFFVKYKTKKHYFHTIHTYTHLAVASRRYSGRVCGYDTVLATAWSSVKMLRLYKRRSVISQLTEKWTLVLSDLVPWSSFMWQIYFQSNLNLFSAGSSIQGLIQCMIVWSCQHQP